MRITCVAETNRGSLQVYLQNHAKEFALEGLVQPLTDTRVRVIVCGTGEAIEEFVDALHKCIIERMVNDIEVEPFLKDRDYRGVFRVIE